MSEPPTILLDGVADEELLPPRPGRSLLGRDPFGEPDGSEPLLRRLGEILAAEPPLRPAPGPPLRDREPSVRQRRSTPPSLSEVEAPEPRSWWERFVDESALRRLAALEHMVESGGEYDEFGLSPRVVRSAFPFFRALHKGWFRVESRGAEGLPREGGALLAANHGGLLPFDGAMAVMDLLLQTDPPRLVRSVVDRWAGSLPWVNLFLARVGQVVGTRENVADLLAGGQYVLVFPEGMDGIRKPFSQRYRLQRFHMGFVEQALRARVPIVPVAIAGSDDQAPILFDVKPLARWLKLPVAPITPTFPWLGPAGLIPYPVRYRIAYGEPLAFHERFGPEEADDPRLVRYLANQVRREIQLLLDRRR